MDKRDNARVQGGGHCDFWGNSTHKLTKREREYCRQCGAECSKCEYYDDED